MQSLWHNTIVNIKKGDIVMNKLYEAVVTSKGGRNGRIKSDDGMLDFVVTFPKVMGGTGEGTNPEQLFAGAYASCFEQAVKHMADVHDIELKDTSVTARVAVFADETGAFSLGVKLEVKLEGCDAPEKLVKLADAACPYSKAVKGNIPVEIVLI